MIEAVMEVPGKAKDKIKVDKDDKTPTSVFTLTPSVLPNEDWPLVDVDENAVSSIEIEFIVDAKKTPIPADYQSTLTVSLAADSDWVFKGKGIEYGKKSDKNHEIATSVSECKKLLALVISYNNASGAGEEEADFVFTCKEKNNGNFDSQDPGIIVKRIPN